MLTAHLPAGYCLARLSPRRAPYVLAAALLGAVLPDFDLLAFYLLDGRSIHHHRYWVHVPLFWAAAAVIWARSRGRAKKIASPAFSPLNPR